MFSKITKFRHFSPQITNQTSMFQLNNSPNNNSYVDKSIKFTTAAQISSHMNCNLQYRGKYGFSQKMEMNENQEDINTEEDPKFIYQRYVTDAEEKAIPNKLKSFRSFAEKPYLRISVPRNYHQVSQKGETDWQRIFKQKCGAGQNGKDQKQKHVILLINTNPADLIYSKRFFTRKHMEENVYGGQGEAPRLLTDHNPDNYVGIEELEFNEVIFLCTDQKIGPEMKKYMELQALLEAQENQGHWTQKQEQQFERQLKQIQQKINRFYEEEDPLRVMSRLHSQYKVPKNLCKVVEETMLTLSYEPSIKNKTDFFFVGVNEYALRNVLTNILSLHQIKQLFMRSLHYSKLMISKRVEKILQQKTKHQIRKNPKSGTLSYEQYEKDIKYFYSFEQLARQLVYVENYDKLYKIENGEIIKKAKEIELWKRKELQTEKQEKLGWSWQGIKDRVDNYLNDASQLQYDIEMILIANEPTVQTLNHPDKYKYEIINDLHHFKFEKKIFKQNQDKGKGQNEQVDNDYVKLEKHAILDVMLGKLWMSGMTNKKFPFLSENYNQLSDSDKQNVDKLFRNNYIKYLGAKNIYFKQNIDILFNSQKAQNNSS